MGDISYLNTVLYSLRSKEGAKESQAICMQHQEKVKINSKSKFSLLMTEANLRA